MSDEKSGKGLLTLTLKIKYLGYIYLHVLNQSISKVVQNISLLDNSYCYLWNILHFPDSVFSKERIQLREQIERQKAARNSLG